MQTEPTGSPVPGVIPAPIRVHPDSAAGNEQGGVAIQAPPPRRRGLFGKLISHLRGDRYMVDAYPPRKEP
jgi:hypothetical protein